jgi:hypothetical protein
VMVAVAVTQVLVAVAVTQVLIPPQKRPAACAPSTQPR